MATTLTSDPEEMDAETVAASRNGFIIVSVLLLAFIVSGYLQNGNISTELLLALTMGQVAYWATYAYRS